MKCCAIDSKDLFTFDVWSAKFYCNTNKEDRDKVLLFKSEKKAEVEVYKLKNKLKTFMGYDRIVRKAKKELGLINTVFATPRLNFKPRVNLLILKTSIRELYLYQIKKFEELKYTYNKLNEDMHELEKLKK